MILVDAANVVGSRPNGWWRDRAGAARTFVARLRASTLERPVVVVLEGKAKAGAPETDDDGVRVVHAPGKGDDTMAALAAPGVRLVTADRELAERASASGAEVVGPSWLLDRV